MRVCSTSTVQLLLTVLLCTASVVRVCQAASGETVSAPPTFSRDVAPILFQKCASCHRPLGAAPFPLLSWEDARKRHRQIADVTKSLYMPPWLPEAGHLPFQDERRLSRKQVDVLSRWAEAGAPRGDPDEEPPRPVWKSGWQLGEPDLVLTMPDTFVLPAQGSDVIRYFALPNPLADLRYVRGFEFHPGNGKIVHHARMLIDLTGLSARLDDQDPEPGFERGMSRVGVTDPDGHWLGWTPGKQPVLRDPEMAWHLRPGSAIVLEMHMVPTGKEETIRSSLGLYFTPDPPTHQPVILRFGSNVIDIPPGGSDYITDEYRIPTDLELLNVYPHAHLLATQMQAWATFPDGRRQTLLEIKRWNFDWQDEYRYLSPVFLPRGTVLSMRYEYDNSASNPRNPFNPPQRVVWGEQTENEMGDLWFQVLTRSQEDRVALNRHYFVKEKEAWRENYQRQLEVDPDNDNAHFNVGSELVKSDLPQAMHHFREVIRINPNHAEAHFNLASAYEERGDLEKAWQHFSRAVEISPGFGRAQGRLGILLAHRGEWTEAIERFQRSLETHPGNPLMRNNLGTALLSQGRLSEAEPQFKMALELEEFADPHYNLGTLYAARRQWSLAEAHFQRAIAIRPSFIEAINDLGNVFAEQRKWEQAEKQFQRAVEVDPGFAPAREALRQIRSILGRP